MNLQRSQRDAKLQAEWILLTNKERKRYRLEDEVAKARAEADRPRQVEEGMMRLKMKALRMAAES